MASTPDRFATTTVAAEARELPDGAPVALAGRLRLVRVLGGLTFAQLQDRSGYVQISLRRGELPEERYADWVKQLKVGAFVGVRGEMWTTNTGERTVRVEELELLGTPQRPFPDKWAGIESRELVFRRQYLELLTNDESRNRFLLRARVIRFLRRFLDEHGFLEVETPILQPAASGAAARPFVTHHNALDVDLYLRVAPETYLKRAVVGSLERVYELGRNFRNEGVDPSHLQEFTMLEWYVAYWSWRDNLEFLQRLLPALVRECLGTETVRFDGHELDFGAPWREVDYRSAVQEATGIDLRAVRTAEELRAEADARGVELDAAPGASYATLVDTLYKRLVRPSLIQPTVLVGHPAELVPLARRNDDDPTKLDMFQLVVAGWELVKAYSELVDPVEQRARLEEQAALRAQGDEETMMLEEDYLEAMEYGMPPMSGLGLGIDRLLAILTDAPSLRDVVLFPPVRALATPRSGEEASAAGDRVGEGDDQRRRQEPDEQEPEQPVPDPSARV